MQHNDNKKVQQNSNIQAFGTRPLICIISFRPIICTSKMFPSCTEGTLHPIQYVLSPIFRVNIRLRFLSTTSCAILTTKIKDLFFEETLNTLEKAAWMAFKSLTPNFLGNHSSLDYVQTIEILLHTYNCM